MHGGSFELVERSLRRSIRPRRTQASRHRAQRSTGAGTILPHHFAKPAVRNARVAGRAARRRSDTRAARRSISSARAAAPSRRSPRCATCCGRPSKAGSRTSGSFPTPKQQAQTASGKRQGRADRESRCLADDYPHAAGRGPRWRATSIELPNGVVIEVVRHRAADSRPAAARASADADRLRRPAERQPHRVGGAARGVAAVVSWHAAQGRHEADERRQPGDGAASRSAGAGAAHRGRAGRSQRFRGDRIVADEHGAVGRVGGDLLQTPDEIADEMRPSTQPRSRQFYRARAFEPRTMDAGAQSSSGRRWKISTR